MADFFTTPLGIGVIIVAQCLAVLGFVMVSLLFLVYGDRKIWAAVQMRRGPNVVGAYGLLQTVADALKYVVKEVVVPAGADKPVFMLAPLTSFVLPGGSEASARLHVARAAVRRAERACVALAASEAVNPQALAYINRLSDYLFVLARVANSNGADDVKWVPGANR